MENLVIAALFSCVGGYIVLRVILPVLDRPKSLEKRQKLIQEQLSRLEHEQ